MTPIPPGSASNAHLVRGLRVLRGSLLGVLLLVAASAGAQTVRSDLYITNGQVSAQVLRGNTLYLGGSFSFVGPVTGSGIPVDQLTGAPEPGFPRVNGTVMAAAPDGAGGWYIGGLFTSVGGVPRSNLARVLADHSLASWNPGTNGTVRALAVRGTVVYVGGDFTALVAVARNRIGAVDATSGALATWNPNANSSVRTFAVGTSVLYVGGQFTAIGGQVRNRVAAIAFTTGTADPAFNPNSNSLVLSSALDAPNNTLYLGGQFTSVDGQTRNRIAAVNATTGAATAWNPNANNQIFALALDGGTVYAGGQFTTIGGQSRSRIAALDGAGLATSWNPVAGNTVQTLSVAGSTIYAGGDFLTLGGQNRSRIAELDRTTGLATTWNPSAFGTVQVLAQGGGDLFVGGTFNGIGGTARNNLAALDIVGGGVTSWDPNANNVVQALWATDDALYVGGNFTQVGGQIRNNVAALDLTNGLALAFDPNSDGQVSALAHSGDRIYLGGLFNSIGGQPRVNLAAVDATSGALQAWTADADNQIFAIELTPSAVMVGGNFTVLGGAARDFVGALDPVTAAVRPWAPEANGTVRALAATCDRVYIGGFFTSIGASARNRLACVDLGAGAATAWDPNANGPVFTIVPASGTVYVGGVFSAVGGLTRNRLASVDPVSGLPSTWNPNSNGTVRALSVTPSFLYVGGAFSSMGGEPSGNLAGVTPDATIACPVITLPSSPLLAVVVGTAYSRSFAASGGVAPYCYRISAGALPAGLSIDGATGLVSGAPTTPGNYAFAVSASDANGCTGTLNTMLSVTPTAAVNQVSVQTAGLCLNPGNTVVSVPFAVTRGDAIGLRGISVTFQLDTALLRLASPSPAVNLHPGTWASGFGNRSLQITDLGGGRFTVDAVLLGSPCGATSGGSLFTLDLSAQGPAGAGAITITSVTMRDCSNAPVAVSAGAAGALTVSTNAIVLAPASLPSGTSGTAYSQLITASGSSGPFSYSVVAGALPAGLTLASGGQLTGSPLANGTFNFTVRASEAGGCFGERAYSLVLTCPTIVLGPVYLPDGAIGLGYTANVSAVGGVAPVVYTVSAGTLPGGLTLTPSGGLGGTPTTAATSVFTITATDAAGCTGSRAYTVDIFATSPVSSVAARTTGLAITSGTPCVSVPFVYTRGENAPVRGVTVSFQLDPAKLALCGSPMASVQLGGFFTGFANTNLQIVDDGGGAYTVDVSLLGSPCGITSTGTLFTLDLQSVGPDGTGAITVTRVKSRDCSNVAIAVMPGPAAALRIQNTPLVMAPPTLPNAQVGTAYSQALTVAGSVAPLSCSVSAGSLPPGVTLSSAGLLSGVPAATGSFAFTARASDADGVPASRSYTLVVTCPVIALTPPTLPDAQTGAAYSQTLVATGGTAPYTFTLTSGSLPAGLTLSAAGEIGGVPTSSGAEVFTVSASDNYDCTGSESYTLGVFADPAVSRIEAVTAGLCLSATRTCVRVPFMYRKGESAPARLTHVKFSLDPRLALCSPGSPTASILPGSWSAGFSNRVFQVLDLGGGQYSVDIALLGLPCGPTTGGELFTVDVAAAGPDGVGDITIIESRVRGCDNAPLPAQPGAPAQLVVSHSAPTAIANLAAVQRLSGNGTSGRTGIVVSWTTPVPGPVALYRAPFGAYPEYDDGGGVAPDAALAPAAPWVLVSSNATSGLVDQPTVRGSWHYVAFVTDSCGNRSAVSNRTPGALDYHLGDVSDGVVLGQGDNKVRLEDVSLLGAHYGISGTTLVTDNVAYLDVGPTIDGLPTSRPATDDVIDFEDLMLFSQNFTVVSAPATRARPAGPSSAATIAESFELASPSLVGAGDEFVAELSLAANGRMQGFAVQLAWDASVLEPLGAESAGYAESQGGIALVPRAGGIDAALLGVRGEGFGGAGAVARFRFRARREGETRLRIASVVARDAANRTLDPAGLARSQSIAAPARTVLLSPAPNPARGAANLAYGLAQRGAVELAVFSVDGRRVRTLAHGTQEAGAYRIAWRGDDDGGHPQAPGVYWARLETTAGTFTRRIVFLR